MAIRTRRYNRYRKLRNLHLVHEEAVEFSKLHLYPRDPMKPWRLVFNPILAKIIQERDYMWQAHRVEVMAKGWGRWKADREWRRKVFDMYAGSVRFVGKEGRPKRATNWLVSRDIHGDPLPRRSISPWELYDALKVEFDYQDWDSPRTHRRKSPIVSIKKIELARWVHDLSRSISETIDPARKRQLVSQRHNLILKLREAK